MQLTLCLQLAQHSKGAFKLAVSVTRPTEQDSAQQLQLSEAAPAVEWYQGRITAKMVAQVS